MREMFYSIDKDRSGDITVKVKYSDVNNYAVTIVDIRLQEALRACRRTSVMGHLGVEARQAAGEARRERGREGSRGEARNPLGRWPVSGQEKT